MFSMVNQVREWPLLLQVIGRPEWETDPRFATAPARQENAETMVQAMEEIFASQDWEHWRHKFMAAGGTVGPISEPEDHFDCPQVAANGLLPEFADETGLRTIDSPVRVAEAPHVAPRHAPRIGQHSEAILKELGFSGSAIVQLVESGAVGVEG